MLGVQWVYRGLLVKSGWSMATERFVNRMSIALLGGTFDPIHTGHIGIAKYLCEHLKVDELRLVPCGRPSHKQHPVVSNQHRLAMLQIALKQHPELSLQTNELASDTPSYTINTLRLVRTQIGPNRSLFMCIGMDALNTLHEWKEWKSILDYANIVVVARPNASFPETTFLVDWIRKNECNSLKKLLQMEFGVFYFCNSKRHDISSTEIRDLKKQRFGIKQYVSPGIESYITENNLYC
ncbi:MAG: hypothetical protein CBC09_05790 [Cellvibrionales bacterium TMED49]|nr:nicotinate (nicotinamide) nucleotide adenylyltransferase [Porticoccaceae bacterium]OUU38282.1 MAG: hypothetical protein CBC09_05790 [Cellvibrionales bacterium TMED49]